MPIVGHLACNLRNVIIQLRELCMSVIPLLPDLYAVLFCLLAVAFDLSVQTVYRDVDEIKVSSFICSVPYFLRKLTSLKGTRSIS
jgi:hypothetical protein